VHDGLVGLRGHGRGGALYLLTRTHTSNRRPGPIARAPHTDT
jgi:hypothetical protein